MSTISGYKTYLVALAMVVFGVTGLFTKQLTGDQAITVILTGLGFAGLRNAIPTPPSV